MNLETADELKRFTNALGYPFNLILKKDSNNPESNFNSDWKKISKSFKVFDDKATDEQLLICSDVSKIYKFMPTFFAALSSRNGFQAIKRLADYEQLVGPIVIKTFEEGDRLRIHINYTDNYRKHSRFSLLVDQISLVSLLRTGTKLLIKPISIGSKFEYGSKIIAYLKVKPQKSQDNYIVFSKEDLFKPFFTSNNIIWDFIQPGLKKYIKKTDKLPPFYLIVRNKLFKLIVGGNFDLKAVADSLGLSPRTVERRLKSEGTSYREQVNYVQRILAQNLLQDQNLSTLEVCFLVGFSNISSFYEAFKRWTGKTVLEYRRQIIYNKNIE